MLGYIPLRVEPPTCFKVLAADLLEGVGGEAKVEPVAGQRVKLAASAVVAAHGGDSPGVWPATAGPS